MFFRNKKCHSAGDEKNTFSLEGITHNIIFFSKDKKLNKIRETENRNSAITLLSFQKQKDSTAIKRNNGTKESNKIVLESIETNSKTFIEKYSSEFKDEPCQFNTTNI